MLVKTERMFLFFIMKNSAKFKTNSLKKAVAAAAKMATSANANSTCMLFAYQPKLPESAKKLRKF